MASSSLELSCESNAGPLSNVTPLSCAITSATRRVISHSAAASSPWRSTGSARVQSHPPCHRAKSAPIRNPLFKAILMVARSQQDQDAPDCSLFGRFPTLVKLIGKSSWARRRASQWSPRQSARGLLLHFEAQMLSLLLASALRTCAKSLT